VSAACAAAAAAAALPTLLLGALALFAFPIALLIAGGHMLLFGLPTYLVLRSKRPVDWPQALVAGFLVGAVPMAAWQLLMNAMLGSISFSLGVFLITGLLGMIGGAVFRAVIGPPVDARTSREVAAVFD
jgi:hypothetical protein